ncbi:D-alanyl-lipoteichoic acid biosynthesis protein DltB [Olsenella sp. HMSC062G07]|uniref:D-alanyl-lipoteichoic acid biosynthesis protein DltB n=1 Tax=Olsenella sp. HMSC062G07 TaxID=1739330 RepID=UPI0008A3377F|nr:D-alanyl-lipoteichoic acid biosynthesis protein DltB [Olsenella sp. HMSC062G07]OFK23267.1 D-alanyl-lipoteichoic acid biosynthesis protein DltB [Olsenella sp. HMSC062G07]
MSFYIDPSFFVLLVPLFAGAAFLGLRERSLRRYGFVTSLLMLGLLFARTPAQAAYAAGYLALVAATSQWLLRDPGSNPRFRASLAVVIAPLVVCKVSGVFGADLMGFVGISYLTFRAVQVLVETHDGLVASLSVLDHLYFLTFFPTFVSGPIDRSRRFVQDVRRILPRDEYAGLLAKGILLVLLGMVYKIVLAALAKRYYIPVPLLAPAGDIWWRLLIQLKICGAYGLYLFFDFAGYSLMAQGISYVLGVRTPRNFRAPFLATSMADFWRRWHITLSSWLRDFVFMRLARRLMRRHRTLGRLRASQLALVANMLLMGLWHGITVNYVLYGLFHGVILALERSWEKTSLFKRCRYQAWYRLCSWAVTMMLVFVSLALFSGQVSLLVRGA